MQNFTKFKRPEPTLFIGFDEEGIQTEKLTVVGYVQGERTDTLKGLTVDFYDQVQFMGRSENTKNERKFIHATGWTKQKNIYQPLILKIK